MSFHFSLSQVSNPALQATRDGFGEALVELGEQNPDIVVLTADLAESTRVLEFSKKHPDRFFDCGVAEQNMMGIAAGLAASGKTPFVSSYAVFSPGRSWDQLRVSVAYSNLPVKIAGHHTGLMAGPDGATHQALEDIAITRVLPNMTVVVPCDAIEAKKATIAAASHPGPVYLRFTREKSSVFTTEESPFEIGKANVLCEGTDVTIVACGPMVGEALFAAEELAGKASSVKREVGCEMINLHTIKPIDIETLVKSAKKTGRVVTVEDHQVAGGMGSAVAEVLARHYPVPIAFVGMQDKFGESGQPEALLKKYHMMVEDIVEAAQKVMSKK